MKVIIIRVRLTHLWNSEYCMFVRQIGAIFLRFNTELLHLKKAFERVMALMPEIAKIKAQELGNVISNQLADLNTERRTLIITVMDMVKNFGRMSIPSMAPHVEVMNRFLDKHGREIGSLNYNANTDDFNKLLADYDASADVQNAVIAMQLVLLINHLREINTQFAALYVQRDDENSSVEKVNAEAIRAEMDKTLTALYDAFEYCSTEYDELDYQTPANKLNETISHYKTQLKARETRRHQGQDVHTEEPIVAPA